MQPEQPINYHGLLLKQLQETLGQVVNVPHEYEALLKTISDTYAQLEDARKKADATAELRTNQLIASTSRAYSFLDSIHKGFIMCDTSGEIVLTNNSLRHILSLRDAPIDSATPPQPVTGEISVTLLESMFPRELYFREIISQCLKNSQSLQCDAVNFGKRVLRLYFAPVLNDPGTADQQLLGVVILVEDITEEKVLEHSKDEFLSIASHELRTPLTAIRGNASLLRKYYTNSITDTEMVEMISDIHESSIRLINIVNDFLDVAAIEQGKIRMQPKPFPMQEVVVEVVRELERLCADKGVQLVADLSIQSAPPVFADKQRIKQVLINLVGNAIKFTEKGNITISATFDHQFVHISVTDTGKGMTEDSQKMLFHKFQQASSSILTRDTTKGTGLGLYISKLIVEISGGTIGLQSSTENVGSTFSFTLPRNVPPPPPAY